MHVLESIDPSRPHALQLLGKQLVLWRDGQGKWQCMEDACPHRYARSVWRRGGTGGEGGERQMAYSNQQQLLLLLLFVGLLLRHKSAVSGVGWCLLPGGV